MEIDFTPQERFEKIITILAEGTLNLIKYPKEILKQFLHLRVLSSAQVEKGTMLVDTSAVVYAHRFFNFMPSNSAKMASSMANKTISKHIL